MGHLTSLVVRIILQGSLFDFDENWRVGPGGSIYYTNSNEVTGNQPWQWTIPRFTDDFPIKTSIYRRFPATFDTASGNMSSGATSQLSGQHG